MLNYKSLLPYFGSCDSKCNVLKASDNFMTRMEDVICGALLDYAHTLLLFSLLSLIQMDKQK